MYLASDRRYQLFRLNAPTLFPCYFTMFTVVHEKAPCAALYQHHTACTFSFPTPIIWLTCLNLFSKLPQVDLLCFPICIQSQQRCDSTCLCKLKMSVIMHKDNLKKNRDCRVLPKRTGEESLMSSEFSQRLNIAI